MTEVHASIGASDVSAFGIAAVTVENPGEDGGTSVSRQFDIAASSPHQPPVVSSIDPVQAPVGSAGLTLTLHGTGFLPVPSVSWNGSVRPATFVSPTVITVAITAADLAIAGFMTVAAESYPPGGGVSNVMLFRVLPPGVLTLRSIDLPAYDLMNDPESGILYAAVAGTGGERANSLTKIYPQTATIGSSVFVGSEPGRISRSDDGQYFYVALKGAAAVRRYNVAAGTAEIQFTLGSDPFFGPMYAEDIAVLPGLPHSVAVSTMWLGLSPSHAGVRIYDDGVVRPNATAQHTGSNEIEAASATTLYGANTETTEFGIRTMNVSAAGVTVTQVFSGLSSFRSGDLVLAGGMLYTPAGSVIDPVAGQLVGSFSGGSGPLAVDLSNDRVFFLSAGNIRVYQASNFAYVGTMALQAGLNGGHLVRWGSDGLAFIASTIFGDPGTTVYLLTTTFLPGS